MNRMLYSKTYRGRPPVHPQFTISLHETRFLEPGADPKPAKFLTAFGETKELKEWAKDERCVVHRKTFSSRIETGWDCEAALTTQPIKPNSPLPDTLDAFGERKARIKWARDKRCVVPPKQFSKRLQMGWPCEAALCLTAEQATKRHIVWSEKKSLTGWLADPRCAVTASILLDRLEQGQELMNALTEPVPGIRPEVWGIGTLPHKKYKRTYAHIEKHEAFGEAKALSVWALDSRCKVSYSLLSTRVRKGLPVEAALIFTRHEEGLVHKQFWAFGERQRLFDWLRDPRLKVSPSVLKERLDGGESMEMAMTRSESGSAARMLAKHQRRKKELTLFGRTATPWEWGKDPRCEISVTTLKKRLAEDWPRTPAILKLASDTPRNEAEKRVLEQFEAYTYEEGAIGRFRSLRLAEQAVLARAGMGYVAGLLHEKKWWPVPRPKRERSFFSTPGERKERKPRPEKVSFSAEVGSFYTKKEVAAWIGTAKFDLLPTFDGEICAVCYDGRLHPEAPERVIVRRSRLMESKASSAAAAEAEIPAFRRRRDHMSEARTRGWEYVGVYKITKFDEGNTARENALKAIDRTNKANPRRGHSIGYKIWSDKEALMLKLAGQGLKYTEIAKMVGAPKTSVFRYIKNAQLARPSSGVSQGKAKASTSSQIAKTAALPDIAGILILERVGDYPRGQDDQSPAVE